jgi:uncharacterized protein (DUF2249 family)
MTIVSTLDVRSIVPRERHMQIFQLFDSLQTGEAFLLVNDHAPRPLYYEFLHERSNLFSWDYLEEGPEVWKVQIGRI